MQKELLLSPTAGRLRSVASPIERRTEQWEAAIAYWAEAHQNASVVELPAEGSRPLNSGWVEGRSRLELPPELRVRLGEVARLIGVHRSVLYLAALQVLLSRLTGQRELFFGVVQGTRSQGRDILVQPLLSRAEGKLGFRTFTLEVAASLAGTAAHALPTTKLEQIPSRVNTEGLPVVQFLFAMQTPETIGPAEGARQATRLAAQACRADLAWSIGVSPTNETVEVVFNQAWLLSSEVERWLGHFAMLLRGIVANPETRLSQLPLLSYAERERLVVEWNATATDYPRSRCVHELVEEQARQRPGAVAVQYGEEQLTYRQLNHRANQVAHYLRKQGVTPGMKVGVYLERSLEMVTGILGVLKAGCAYAPLEPHLPQQRLRSMLQDLQVPLILTQRRWLGVLERCLERLDYRVRPLCLDADWKSIAGAGTGNLCVETEPYDVAYISFTSGSTGQPKGVCVPHRGIVRLVRNTNWMRVRAQDVLMQLAPVAFDASLLELWGSLANGARLIVAPPELPSLAELAALIHRYHVTIAWFTAGLFNQMVEEVPMALVPLRLVLTGGDTASPAHCRKALQSTPGGEVFNCYGPTENSTFSTVYKIPRGFDETRPVPIGRPVANSQCYILDEHLEPVPIGVTGELYVGGDGLALGYLNRPDLTAERFIEHPLTAGARLYRTGDLARYLSDGNIEFLGRKDQQVKIGGYRVELGEVEAILNQHPQVQQCAVKAWPDETGGKQLAAYIVPTREARGHEQDWASFLRERLPEYMQPAHLVTVEELPLSNTGKVDRRALPRPAVSVQDAASCARLPADETERKVLEAWEALLEARPIGWTDNFFTLGGHSLLALRLAARLEKAFGHRVPVARIFENPTMQQLSALLRQGHNGHSASALVEIQTQGQLPPLYLVHGAGGGMFWGYSNLARHLGPEQPVLAFKSRGLEGLEEPETIEALAESYVEELARSHAHGPYRLGGYCFGGLVAYEMARQLAAAGERVALLALINSDAPNSSYNRFCCRPGWFLKFGRNICAKAYYSLPRTAGQWAAFLSWRARRARRQLGRMLGLSTHMADPERWLNLSGYSDRQRRLWQKHVQALSDYHPGRYAGPVILFRSPLHLLYCSFDPWYGWADFVRGGLTVRTVPAAHDRIMEEPYVERLAAALRPELSVINDGLAG